MIQETDKPTPWEGEGDHWFRRAAVWPNVLCRVFRHRGERPVSWAVSLGLPGVTVDEETGEAPSPEEAKAAASDAAAKMIGRVQARMVEALSVMPTPPADSPRP